MLVKDAEDEGKSFCRIGDFRCSLNISVRAQSWTNPSRHHSGGVTCALLTFVRRTKENGSRKKEIHHFAETWVTGSLPHLMSLKHLIEQLVKILKLTYEGLRVMSGGKGGIILFYKWYSILNVIDEFESVRTVVFLYYLTSAFVLDSFI